MNFKVHSQSPAAGQNLLVAVAPDMNYTQGSTAASGNGQLPPNHTHAIDSQPTTGRHFFHQGFGRYWAN